MASKRFSRRLRWLLPVIGLGVLAVIFVYISTRSYAADPPPNRSGSTWGGSESDQVKRVVVANNGLTYVSSTPFRRHSF